jgi:hypothetical protein
MHSDGNGLWRESERANIGEKREEWKLKWFWMFFNNSEYPLSSWIHSFEGYCALRPETRKHPS